MSDSTLYNPQEQELREQIKALVLDGVLEADVTRGKDKPFKIEYPISVIDDIMSLISSYTKQARIAELKGVSKAANQYYDERKRQTDTPTNYIPGMIENLVDERIAALEQGTK